MGTKHPAHEKWTTDNIWIYNGAGRRIARLERASRDGEFIAALPELARAARQMLVMYYAKRDEPGSFLEQEQAAAELHAVLADVNMPDMPAPAEQKPDRPVYDTDPSGRCGEDAS